MFPRQAMRTLCIIAVRGLCDFECLMDTNVHLP